MRSVSNLTGSALGLLSAALLLSGCVTTQQVAARARLVDARIRISQSPLLMTRRDPRVRITQLVLLRGSAGTAVVVGLRDTSARSLTDLPITVGVITRAGRKLGLNRAANLDYFDSHIAALAPRRTVTWVFTSPRRLPVTDRPFAEVGSSTLAPPPAGALPRIAVTLKRSASAPGGRTVQLSVANRSAIPQYEFPVYAVGRRGGRDVSAGRVTVAHLGTDGATTLRLTLLGRRGAATISVSALPTIFQ